MPERNQLYARPHLYIDGAWVAPMKDASQQVISPATERVVGTAAWAGVDDARAAVAAAKRAATGDWSRCTFEDRAALVEEMADHLDALANDAADLTVAEQGQPRARAKDIGRVAARMMRAAVDCARQVPLRDLRRDSAGSTLVQLEPVGVVGALVPFNGPLTIAVLKVAPALLAGCPVVLKPSPHAVLPTFLLAEAAHEAGLPAGMLNLVTGDADVGKAVVEHDDVALVSFTGSTEVGRSIAEKAGRGLKHISLELGGKSAAIVLDDADLDVAIPLIASAFTSAGQYCRALTRVLVTRGRRDEVIQALVEAAASMRPGDPEASSTNMPPLINASQRERVERYVGLARSYGAHVECGGRRPEALPVGFFYEPTVISGATNDMPFVREEIFGPVVAVLEYEDVEEAIAIANDSEYGLSGAVFTTDLDRGLDIALRVRTGTIGINQHGARSAAPCGGVKASGIGQEHGPEGFMEFLTPKAIMIPEALRDRLEREGVASRTVVR